MASYTAGAYPALAHLASTYLSNIAHYTIHPFLIYYEIVQPALNSPAEWFENHVLIEHPLTLSLHVLFAMIVYTLGMSTATGNYSSVDRLWSIVPFVYAWIFVIQSFPYFDARLTAIAAVTTIWGLRLTFNFARKGGYQNGHEDYRWPWLRALIKTPYGLAGDIAWHIFNVVFISGYQSVLLWAIVAPISMEAWNVRYRPLHLLNKDNAIHTPWNWFDTAALILSLGCIALETIADNQQWAFQTEKYRQLAKAKEGSDRGVLGVSMSKPSVGLGASSIQAQELTKSKVQSNFQQKQKEAAPVVDVNQPEYLSKVEFPYSVGFPTTGLWKYSRHPNFFGEISLWFCLHLFAVASVYVSFTSSQKLNFPTPVSSGIALTQDWRSVLIFCRGATRILIVPVVRYSLAGAVNLWMLFNGSTALTEYLTASKYPWYRVYQARTSRWMPFFSGGEMTAADMKI